MKTGKTMWRKRRKKMERKRGNEGKRKMNEKNNEKEGKGERKPLFRSQRSWECTSP